MKVFGLIISFLFFSMTGFSQENNIQGMTEPVSDMPETGIMDDSHYLNGMVPVGKIDRDLPQKQDSLHLPMLDNYGRVYSHYSWLYPYMGSWGLWNVHEGLNVQLGVSAFTSFGKNSFSGWGQNLSAVYAKPINDRMSLAVGGFMNNYSTGMGTFRNAGITAVLNYRLNEHWEAFVYGQKSFMDNSSTMFSHYDPYGYGMFGYGMMYNPMYDMGVFGDRIGAGVTWKPTQSTSVQVQFEVRSDPRSSFHNRVQEKWTVPEN